MSDNTVSLRDIYEVVNRIEDKFNKRAEDLEKRVNALEDFKARTLGILSIITVVSSAVFSWAWNKFTKSL